MQRRAMGKDRESECQEGFVIQSHPALAPIQSQAPTVVSFWTHWRLGMSTNNIRTSIAIYWVRPSVHLAQSPVSQSSRVDADKENELGLTRILPHSFHLQPLAFKEFGAMELIHRVMGPVRQLTQDPRGASTGTDM